MKITIIGAGIGGLSTAIALQQKGFDVEIFESFPKMKRMGAGIVLANNAMQVYQRLGLSETIYKNANRISTLKLVDENLNTLSEMSMKAFEARWGVHYAAIHRASLQDILLQHISSTQLHLGKRLRHLVENERHVALHFEDGTRHQSDIVIGADGIHSAVRKSILKNSNIRQAKQICWRGVTKMDLPDKFSHQINESWGDGTRFGIVPLAQEEVYWFALANYKQDYKKEFRNPALIKLFSSYHPLIKQIIENTPKENIIANELLDLKPMRQWYSKKVCLIGDAAHTTTPNMGQGACQAIEDALALSICLAQETELEKAFSKFQKLRIKKANKITQQSWRIGKMAQLENNWARKIRNLIMKITPNALAAKQTAKIFELNY